MKSILFTACHYQSQSFSVLRKSKSNRQQLSKKNLHARSMDKILTEKQRFLIDNRHLLTKGQKYKLRSSVKRTLQWQIFGVLTILIIFCYLDKEYFKFLHPDNYKGHDHSRHLLVQQYPTSAFSDVSFGISFFFFFFTFLFFVHILHCYCYCYYYCYYCCCYSIECIGRWSMDILFFRNALYICSNSISM